MQALRGVTYNLGCGGPHPPAREAAAERWADAARTQYDLVFVQELPSDRWLDMWNSTHHVVTVRSPRYRVRSALLVSNTLAYIPTTLPTAHYHDSYVAAATVRIADDVGITCMSVHASPNQVSDEWRRLWSGAR